MHELRALVTSGETAAELRAAWSARSVPLNGGLRIIALDDALLRTMGVGPNWDLDLEDSDTSDELEVRLEPLLNAVRRLSTRGAIAIVLTQYFGGTGQQAAVLLADGQTRLGPLIGEGAVNRILHALGVDRAAANAIDEFEAVGLHKWRTNREISQ